MAVESAKAHALAAEKLRRNGLRMFVVRRVELDGPTVIVLVTTNTRPMVAKLEHGELVWLATGWPA